MLKSHQSTNHELRYRHFRSRGVCDALHAAGQFLILHFVPGYMPQILVSACDYDGLLIEIWVISFLCPTCRSATLFSRNFGRISKNFGLILIAVLPLPLTRDLRYPSLRSLLDKPRGCQSVMPGLFSSWTTRRRAFCWFEIAEICSVHLLTFGFWAPASFAHHAMPSTSRIHASALLQLSKKPCNLRRKNKRLFVWYFGISDQELVVCFE